MEDSGIEDSDHRIRSTHTFHQDSNNKLLFMASSDSSSASSTSAGTPKKSSTIELQRKLEKKIALVRKTHGVGKSECRKGAACSRIAMGVGGGGSGDLGGGGSGSCSSSINSSLIPIQRLPVPAKSQAATARERQPLVEWDTDESEEEIDFFPISQSNKDGCRQELTDTFSIENLELSAEEDEDDLNLVPPRPMHHRCGCCPNIVNAKCTIL